MPGADANKITFLAGPRYTWTANAGNAHRPRLQLFGQGLFGGAHGFGGLDPTSTGVTSTTSSFAIQAGGGLNLLLTKHFGLRLIEADYVRTATPNGYDNTQTDLRLAFGATCHLGAAGGASDAGLHGELSVDLSRRSGHGHRDGRQSRSDANSGL